MNSLATHENLGRTAAGTEKASKQISKIFKIFCSPTAECYGVFAQYRFRCVLGELGRFREGTGFREPVPGTGSGNLCWVTGFPVPRFWFSCVPEVSKVSVFHGFRGVRLCSRGFDGTVSGHRVPGTRGIKKVPGQGFRQLLCTSKVYSCT